MCVLTRGSPEGLSGGHLYHRRMAQAAPHYGAVLSFAHVSLWWRPPAADVLVVDSIAAWRLVPWTVRRGGPRRVAAVHQVAGGVDGSRLGRWVRRRLDAFVYRRCEVVVAVSSPLARDLGRVGVPRSRIRIVEPGSDLVAPVPPRLRRWDGPLLVLAVANWLPNKGILELLDAVDRLPAGAVTLHLVGRHDVDLRYTRRVRARLRAPGLAGRVVVHGAVAPDQLGDIYAGADVFVSTSASESYGTACAEALAMGLPVVGWRLPHMEQLVTDGVDGVLVPPHDVEALMIALQRLSRDVVGRERLAAGARQRRSTLPPWSDTARRFFDALGASGSAVEPADDRTVGAEVDAGDAGVFHEGAPHDLFADAERPRQGGLDGADMGDDDDDRRARRG